MEHLRTHVPAPPVLVQDGEAIFRQHATERTVPRQALIYSPGDPAEQAFLVGSGEIRLSRCSPEGRELTLALLGPGEVFGETAALLDRPRGAQAAARSACVLHVLERDTLRRLAGREPAFALWLTQRLGEREARMESRLETLLFRSANGKVAEVLLHLAQEHGRATAQGMLIDYPITHQEIGNLIATTRETVSYAFMEFRQRGLISTRQRRTVILDAEALGDVAVS